MNLRTHLYRLEEQVGGYVGVVKQDLGDLAKWCLVTVNAWIHSRDLNVGVGFGMYSCMSERVSLGSCVYVCVCVCVCVCVNMCT